MSRKPDDEIPGDDRKGMSGRLDDFARSPTSKAARVAVELLDLEPFFTPENLRSIFNKLEECDRYAQASADFNGDMMFIALSLPLVNGIIHIASNRNGLRRATEWVVKEWQEDDKDPDKVSILSALTLIHLAVKGWQRFRDDPTKRNAWKRIIFRVQKLSTERLHEELE
jgi:hypothetical protein